MRLHLLRIQLTKKLQNNASTIRDSPAALYFGIPDTLRSHRMKRLALAAVLAFSCTFTQAQTAKPKVRAITAFVRLDSKNYQHQLADALTVLHKTEAEFKSAGYE